jgi:hypothetical protein
MKTTKKLSALLFIALLMNINVSHAGTEDNCRPFDLNKFRKHIISQIGFPEKVKHAVGEEVSVLFKINKDMQPEICAVETNNPSMEQFIRSEFEEIKLPEEFHAGNEVYSIKIKFHESKN